jgi:outer membrane biosynthesis protein TonB
MGRTVAVIWHASFSIAAGVLYSFFVLPRWPELSGDTTHTLGTVLRIVAGALIVGTAISEIWFSLDQAGQWLFGIYGAAAAICILGIASFYLAFAAELPPPPPRPLKTRERKRRWRRKGGEEEAETTEAEAKAEAGEEAEAGEAPSEQAEEAEEAEKPEEAESGETAPQPQEPSEEQPAEVTAEEDKPADEKSADSTEPADDELPDTEDTAESEPARGGLRNRRPAKSGTSRWRRLRGGVAVED